MTDPDVQEPETSENPPPKASLFKKIYTFFCETHPKAAYFLLINICLEMIYGSGSRAVYIIYLKQELRLSPYVSKLVLHLSKFAGVMFPIFGALLADMFSGKFWIFVATDWYGMGLNLTLTLSSYFFDPSTQLTVLIVILVVGKLGYIGGPARAAFGGDQYVDAKVEARRQYYYAFYFFVNLGSLLGTLIIPRFRTDYQCIPNNENCFPLAFGVAVFISLIASVILLSGIRFYRFLPPEAATNWKYIKCFWLAVARRICLIFHGIKKCSLKACKHNRDHWIHLADDKYEEEITVGTKNLWNAAIMFSAYPVFWAVFDQQHTLWTMQSAKMDGRTIFGRILPDQMDTFNPLMIMIFVVFSLFVIYPLCAKINFLTRPLERIGWGFFLAAISSFLGAIIYFIIEHYQPAYPALDVTDVAFHNGLSCDVEINFGKEEHFSLKKHESIQLKSLNPNQEDMSGILKIANQSCSLGNISTIPFKVDAEGGFAYSVLFAMQNAGNITFQQARQNRTRENYRSAPKIRFAYVGPDVRNRQLFLQSHNIILTDCVPLNDTFLECSGDECPEYVDSTNTMYYKTDLCYYEDRSRKKKEETNCTCDALIGTYAFERGGIYDVMIIESSDGESSISVFATAEPDSVPVLLQVPMYFLITAGEVLCSVEAYNFAYTEAPKTTKTLIFGVKTICLPLGNLIIVLVDTALLMVDSLIVKPDYLRPEQERPIGHTVFLVYAVIMFLDALFFVFLARRYRYVNPAYQTKKDKGI